MLIVSILETYVYTQNIQIDSARVASMANITDYVVAAMIFIYC